MCQLDRGAAFQMNAVVLVVRIAIGNTVTCSAGDRKVEWG